jgi:hypothetical protein
MTQSQKLAEVQSAVRTAAKFHKQTRGDATADLFGVDASQVEPSFGEANARLDDLKKLWMARIGDQPLPVTEAVFADLICKSNCFPSELQLALRELMQCDDVQNVDAGPKLRPKNVVDYAKGETLVRKSGPGTLGT